MKTEQQKIWEAYEEGPEQKTAYVVRITLQQMLEAAVDNCGDMIKDVALTEDPEHATSHCDILSDIVRALASKDTDAIKAFFKNGMMPMLLPTSAQEKIYGYENNGDEYVVRVYKSSRKPGYFLIHSDEIAY